jgi:hypothetical protein
MITIPSDREVHDRLAHVRDAVEREIPRATRRTTIRRAGLAGAASVIGIAALAGAAYQVALASAHEVATTAICFESADLHSASTTVALAQLQSADGGQPNQQAISPLEACGEMWRAGVIGQPQQPADPNTATFDVPQLVACTGPNGVADVFPRGDEQGDDASLCATLDLAVWNNG